MYHSHSGIQRGDGLFGAIIVRASNDVHASMYDHDLAEHVIIVNDWLSGQSMVEKTEAFIEKGRDELPHADAILINGRGRYRIGDKNVFDDTALPKTVLKVSQGKRYRIRLINAGILACPIQFSIQDHTFSVISSDGQSLEAENDIQSLTLFAGLILFYLFCKDIIDEALLLI